MEAKVFCIGFHKTGTTSMASALMQLGYKVTGPNGVRDPEIEQNVMSMVERLSLEFDAFQDNPWPIVYKEMDEKYPGSKFILTIREPDSWLRSQLAHFGKQTTPMREWIYGRGCPKGNEKVYLSRYKEHNASVLEYFKNRPKDLLVLNLAEGDGWDKLCSFLGKEVPSVPFPHQNRKSDRKKETRTQVPVFLTKLLNRLKK